MDHLHQTRRPAALLAIALAAATGMSVLAPAGASTQREPVSVVVTASLGGVEAAAAAVRAAGGTVLDRLPLVRGVGAELPAGAVLAPGYQVSPNAPLQVAGLADALSTNGPVLTVRESLGLGAPAGEGEGVTVAVVDTGVADHPDLDGRLTHVDVTGTGSGDDFGHGTFVAGIAAGSGASSDGRYAGVAPAASVLDVRVADDKGTTDLLTVLKGLQAVAAHPGGVDVLNISLSSGSPLPYQIDPLTVALDRLWQQGTVVVVPAGNDGPERGSISSPGSDPMLLTVGSLDGGGTPSIKDDVVPSFSARGPAPQGIAKPDLVATGRSLVSLSSPGSVVDLANPAARVGASYVRGSGTSFSTAVVAGGAAAMLAKRPTLSPDDVKDAVVRTAYTARGLRDKRAAGAGGLDVTAAMTAKIRTDRPTRPAMPAGDVDAWHAFLNAVLAGDQALAAHSWALLSPAAHSWAAHSWASLDSGTQQWVAHSWAGHRWAAASGDGDADGQAGDDGKGRKDDARGSDDDASGLSDTWAMRLWAAEQWAGHRWAAGDWVAHSWAGHRWAGHRWAAEDWAGHRWGAHSWAADYR